MYPRSARRRKKKPSKTGLRILQSGMAVSVLVLYTSGQIGSTYGEYNTSLQQPSSIELCSVFPGQIEQLLSELSGHIHRIIELKSSLASHSPAGEFTGPADLSALSPDELDQAAELVAAQISSAISAIAAIDAQLNTNLGIWQQILQEASSAASILHQAWGYMLHLEPNCLEIRDAQIFGQMQLDSAQSGVLSEPLKNTYNEIVGYLSSIHTTGSALPPGNPDRGLLGQEHSRFSGGSELLDFVAKAYEAQPDISAELQAAYEQLNADLTSTRSSLSSAVSNLQNQQLEITDAKAKLQEEALADKADDDKQDGKDPADDKTPVVKAGEGNPEITVPAVPDNGKPAEDKPVEDKPAPDTSAAPDTVAPDAPASGVDTPDPSPTPAAVPVQDITENDNTVPELPAASPVPVTEPSKGGDE
ncbi:hypothetical protein PAECIP111892_03864 [Paenibacillus auburnensis]|uniref:Uncharacterized protein n=1 Tax=Paenibacillus auburnensis TaxID=2905649 RepID=A0ABN8GN46_9BACL|nr:hypothetical protein [Paenibacillus auburnensis]CAH1213519.1 hypothetical protein PAECIP111892_03864 [Paenibacillus auburnensis]